MNLSDLLICYDRPQCEAQVKGFAGAIFKKFKTTDEAKDFIKQKRPNAALSNPLASTVVSVVFLLFVLTVSLSFPLASTSFFVNGIIVRGMQFQATKRSANGSSRTGFERAAKKAKIDEKITTDFTSSITQTQKYADHYFDTDSDGFVHVYTDGSCENNGRANAIAGYGVYFGEGHKL